LQLLLRYVAVVVTVAVDAVVVSNRSMTFSVTVHVAVTVAITVANGVVTVVG